VVALNLVQSEDNLVARRDYTRHMQIVAFLANDVPVALHAGELWLGYVPPPDLTFHIRRPSRSPMRAASGTASTSPSSMTWTAFSPRCAGGRSCGDQPLEQTSSSACAAGTIRSRPTSRPACRWCSTDDAGVSRINLTNEYFRAPATTTWLPDAEGDRPQCLDPLLPRRKAKARRAGALRSLVRPSSSAPWQAGSRSSRTWSR
jgi:adenosine deaminase